MERRFGSILVVLAVISMVSVCFGGGATPAERMTKIIPDGTVGFLAISGYDNVGPAFEKTTVGQVWANPQVRAMVKALKPQLEIAMKEGGNNERGEKAAKLFYRLGKVICRRPAIAGAAVNDITAEVPGYGFAIVDAGPVKQQLKEIIAEIEKLSPETKIIKKQVGPAEMKAFEVKEGVFMYWGWACEKFVWAINDNDGSLLKNIYWPKDSEVAGLDKIPAAGDAFVLNYDFARIMQVLEKMDRQGSQKDYDRLIGVLDELGILGMKSASARLGFKGPNVVYGEYTDIPAPRKGIFDCLGQIELSQFGLAEPQAMQASAFDMDIAKLYDTIFNAFINRAPEKEASYMRAEFAKFEERIGVKIRDGIIASIDGEGLYYIMPAGVMMEAPGGGFVAVLKLKDEKLFEDNMAALGKYAASKSDGMLQISSMPKGDVTVHSWTVMPLAMLQILPCWAVSDGYAVLASNMPLCGKALDRIGSDDPADGSLLKTEKFLTAVKGLPENLASLSYVDSKVQFQQMLGQLQRIWPILNMAAMQNGVKLPAMLPTFDEAVKEMHPNASYCRLDENGIYGRYEGSGIEIGAGVAVGTMGAAMLMPALGKAKKNAQVVVSVTNLKAIRNACYVYANDHNDEYPPNLEVLIKEADLDPDMLVSPRKPKSFKGPSYIYVEGQSDSNPQNVLAYENPAFLKNSTNVLFIDGHIEKMMKQKFIKTLKKTYERLGREMPEIRFDGDKHRKSIEVSGKIELGTENKDKSKDGSKAEVSVKTECKAEESKDEKQVQVLKSVTSLKRIGVACYFYGYDRNKEFPPNLEILVKEADLSPKSLVSPRKPESFKGPSYIYVEGQSGRSNPMNILAYENPGFLTNTINALFVDGHVEKMTKQAFIRELKKTYKRLDKEMPEIKFRGAEESKDEKQGCEVEAVEKEGERQDELAKDFMKRMNSAHDNARTMTGEKEGENCKTNEPAPEPVRPIDDDSIRYRCAN